MARNQGLGDERIVDRGDNSAMRGNPHREPDAQRANEDGTVMTRAERLSMIRDTWQQVALPTPPNMPGYHLCWLSTTNSSDTIQRRMKLGYELVKRDELPGFKVEKPNSAEYSDYVTCNEMVLGKLPADIYEDIMSVFHNDLPHEEETSIRERMQQTAESLNRQAGRQIVEQARDGGESGYEQLGAQRRKPKFVP